MDDTPSQETDEPSNGPLSDEPWWKPYFIRVIAVILILMIASLALFSVGVERVISVVEAPRIGGNTIEMKGVRITLGENVLLRLRDEFLSHPEREIKACLYGNKKGTDYAITSITFPTVLSANVMHISTEGCPTSALIDLHSHPINQCIPSEVDINSYNARKGSNPDLVMMIMCNTDRFAVYVD